MAAIAPLEYTDNDLTRWARWATVTQSDTPGAWKVPGVYPDRSITVTGTFAGGLTIALTGSMDGTTYLPAYSLGGSVAAGSAISFTAAGQAIIAVPFRYLKPTVASGSASSVNIIISCAK